MMAEEMAKIEITDSDIDEVELLLGNVKFDEQRRNILKHMTSADIQAYPGTGKTTVLVAKLAILAKKWSFDNKGICVLSHTNAAKNEIESKLGHTDIGKRLLSYPHFVGTVHSFLDKYVASIWLKSNGVPITLIDSEITARRRRSKLDVGTKIYLKKSHYGDSICETKSYPDISIDVRCGEDTKPYKDMKNVIEQSIKEGYFTFDEILKVAEYALEQYNWLPSAIQERFPFLFIDEAQDTKELQWSLIRKCFPEDGGSVCQFFGDANQAIFDSFVSKETNSRFPGENPLIISNSLRFGNSIAKLSNPLGIVAHELDGESDLYERLDHEHTIFLFENAQDVLPAYAELLLSCFSDEELNGKLPCYTVGMVHNRTTAWDKPEQYPVGVGDYFSGYNSNMAKSTSSPEFMIEFFRLGRSKSDELGDLFYLVNQISDGMLKYIRTKKNIQVSYSGKTFHSLVKIIDDDKVGDFRRDFYKLLSFKIDTEESWNFIVNCIKSLMGKYFGINSFNDDYFKWVDDKNSCESDGNTKRSLNNVYCYEKDGRSVNIHMSSIHAVKGRTHLATLVLDTFWNDRNIKSIVPWLSNHPPKKQPGVQNQIRLKCHYVALTRARGLICVAALKGSVSDVDTELLKEAGWKIVEL